MNGSGLRIERRRNGMPDCSVCKNTANFAGNYVECVLLHRFVDWWWWRSTCPDDCPLLNNATDAQREATPW